MNLVESPFEVVRNEPQDVRNKYLEGQPWKNYGYPGPFQSALTNYDKDMYTQNQQTAVATYPYIAEYPIQYQAAQYPTFNSNQFQPSVDCAQYGPIVPTMSPLIPTESGLEQQRYQSPQSSPVSISEEFKDTTLSDPCSQTGFGQITPQFDQGFPKCTATDNPLLDLKNRPVEHFSHNNMVPYFKKITQNMHSTGVPQAGDNNACDGVVVDGYANTSPFQRKLEYFTGCDETYTHKRELGPKFSPAEQQQGWVYGAPAFRPDLTRYKDSLKLRNNESPVEKQRVGPGIALDYSVPAEGGFQQFTRILPNNVSNYKANQLEGRIIAGKWFAAEHPTAQYTAGVNNNRPKSYLTQARRPTMPTKFFTNSPSAPDSRLTDYTPSANKGKQARSDTEPGGGFGQLIFDSKNPNETKACVSFGEAPVGVGTMKSHVPSQTQDRLSYHTIRETFKRGAAGYTEGKGFWECQDMEQGSHRWDLLGITKGATTDGPTRDGKYLNYTNRGDFNPYVINTTGTANINAGQWNPNSYEQPARVTRKETTAYSYAGQVNSLAKSYNLQPQDDPKVTRKETLAYSYHGNPTGSTNAQTTQYDDDLRVTRKETTGYAYHGNPLGSHAQPSDRFMYTGNTFFDVK
jgi:hypothetical protein